MNIYGNYGEVLEQVLSLLVKAFEAENKRHKEEFGNSLYEHLHYRVKASESMTEKCKKKGFAPTTKTALRNIYDAIGIRAVCRFIDDVYALVEAIRHIDKIHIVEEKDYIKNVKPNGYRSFHVILDIEVPFEDVDGKNPGHFFAEVQIRTIAQDSWASLEHEMMYKHVVKNRELLVSELKRCADELASCDLSMQTIRNLIRSAQD